MVHDQNETLLPITQAYIPNGELIDLGHEFGDYDLQAEIARGGMGVVFRARQRSLNRTVALKLILAGELAGPEAVRRFRAEAEAVASLDHPNVLPIYEVGERHGQQYFSMKLVEGGSLAGKMSKLVGDSTAAAALVAKLARAVEHAHCRGVLHRDLKPANVLLDSDGTPYVTDFGLAKRVGTNDGGTKTGAILGTPSYMAPEQARGDRDLTRAADIYGLGAILYELLAGQPPFRGPTTIDIVFKVLESEPIDPRTFRRTADSDLSLIALKCLEKSTVDRYSSAAALADDLERWLRGEPVTVRRPRLRHRMVGWARREPGLACRLAMIACGGVLVHLNYQFGSAVEFVKHAKIMAILFAWTGVSIACQLLLRRDRHTIGVLSVWLGADVAFLTSLLILSGSEETPLVLLYGLFVVASGLWLQARLVWVSTAAAVASYVVLIGQAAVHGILKGAVHHHAIFVFALVTIGMVVASQVRRARMLTRHFESRSTK